MILLSLKNGVIRMGAKVHWRYYYVIGLIVASVIGWQQYLLGSSNNYQIFISAFSHLINGENLYQLYPHQYDDLFLYNPTFAVFFSPFRFINQLGGMVTWSCFSMAIYLYAVGKLSISKKAKLFLLLLSLPDCINSLQHQQVNHINLSLMLLVPVFLSQKKVSLAAFFTALIFFIKIYPAAIGLCFLFFPNKIKYLGWCLVWSVLLFALPLLFISFDSLLMQYQNWFASLGADRSIEECKSALSLISINYQWLQNPVNPTIIQGIGLGLLFIPLLVSRKYFGNRQWQLNFLAAILLFVIVFNHAAESATYLLAVTGVGLWFLNNERSTINISLLALVIIGTILPVTDLFPAYLKSRYIQPFSVRAVPCVLVWGKIIFDLIKHNDKTREAYV